MEGLLWKKNPTGLRLWKSRNFVLDAENFELRYYDLQGALRCRIKVQEIIKVKYLKNDMHGTRFDVYMSRKSKDGSLASPITEADSEENPSTVYKMELRAETKDLARLWSENLISVVMTSQRRKTDPFSDSAKLLADISKTREARRKSNETEKDTMVSSPERDSEDAVLVSQLVELLKLNLRVLKKLSSPKSPSASGHSVSDHSQELELKTTDMKTTDFEALQHSADDEELALCATKPSAIIPIPEIGSLIVDLESRAAQFAVLETIAFVLRSTTFGAPSMSLRTDDKYSGDSLTRVCRDLGLFTSDAAMMNCLSSLVQHGLLLTETGKACSFSTKELYRFSEKLIPWEHDMFVREKLFHIKPSKLVEKWSDYDFLGILFDNLRSEVLGDTSDETLVHMDEAGVSPKDLDSNVVQKSITHFLVDACPRFLENVVLTQACGSKDSEIVALALQIECLLHQKKYSMEHCCDRPRSHECDGCLAYETDLSDFFARIGSQNPHSVAIIKDCCYRAIFNVGWGQPSTSYNVMSHLVKDFMMWRCLLRACVFSDEPGLVSGILMDTNVLLNRRENFVGFIEHPCWIASFFPLISTSLSTHEQSFVLSLNCVCIVIWHSFVFSSSFPNVIKSCLQVFSDPSLNPSIMWKFLSALVSTLDNRRRIHPYLATTCSVTAKNLFSLSDIFKELLLKLVVLTSSLSKDSSDSDDDGPGSPSPISEALPRKFSFTRMSSSGQLGLGSRRISGSGDGITEPISSGPKKSSSGSLTLAGSPTDSILGARKLLFGGITITGSPMARVAHPELEKEALQVLHDACSRILEIFRSLGLNIFTDSITKSDADEVVGWCLKELTNEMQEFLNNAKTSYTFFLDLYKLLIVLIGAYSMMKPGKVAVIVKKFRSKGPKEREKVISHYAEKHGIKIDV